MNNEEMYELVLARLSVMPENIQIHFDSDRDEYDKAKLIKHVKLRDPIGEKFVKLQMQYIKASMNGFSI